MQTFRSVIPRTYLLQLLRYSKESLRQSFSSLPPSGVGSISTAGYILSVFIIAACFLPTSCGPKKASVYKKTKYLMDTVVSLTVVAGSESEAEKTIDRTFSVIEQFGDRINFFSDKSELSAVNRNAGVGPVRVSPDTLGVVERAIHIAQISGGAFDPTIGPEVGLWDFSAKRRPSDADIRKNLNLVDYRGIAVDGKNSTVFLRKKGMLLDLGGIAKGYAADLALAHLKQNGIKAGVIATAGDIRVFGLKPDGAPWRVGIKNPRQKGEADEILATMLLSDKAISTSGDYERYFEEDGRRYHHILNPRTGYPAGLCRSVTVVSANGIYADGFSTALFVLGPEKGIELARSRGVDALIIDSSGAVHTTPGLKGVITYETGH